MNKKILGTSSSKSFYAFFIKWQLSLWPTELIWILRLKKLQGPVESNVFLQLEKTAQGSRWSAGFCGQSVSETSHWGILGFKPMKLSFKSRDLSCCDGLWVSVCGIVSLCLVSFQFAWILCRNVRCIGDRWFCTSLGWHFHWHHAFGFQRRTLQVENRWVNGGISGCYSTTCALV